MQTDPNGGPDAGDPILFAYPEALSDPEILLAA